ncbi:uncharacterized protein LOC124148176 [Haliotis rufescens]|uniref:uncharacterized protein LOC124148176 n=1 Tax=Haliotis rufescens TaxID=6454 RepID=UPI00201F2FEB|nr:uncharacterized protein LOC124148176 [Haliotis rufescens]
MESDESDLRFLSAVAVSLSQGTSDSLTSASSPPPPAPPCPSATQYPTSEFVNTLGLVTQGKKSTSDTDPQHLLKMESQVRAAMARAGIPPTSREADSSVSETNSDLDLSYLSHIQSLVSKTGFTSPQQIYETISSMSKDDATHASSSQPSVYNMPSASPVPVVSTSNFSPSNQLESFLSIPVLPSSKDRGRRIELTLQEKVDLIHHSKGKSQRALAEIFGVGKSQVNLILKRKREIMNMYEQGGQLERKRLRLRADKDEINSLTLDWFMSEYKKGDVSLSGPVVQEKAKEFALELGRTEFRASNGWLHSFCKRNNIGFNSKQGMYVKDTTGLTPWPSQVVSGNEGWGEDASFVSGQGDEEEAAQSDASEDNSAKNVETADESISTVVSTPEPNTPGEDPAKDRDSAAHSKRPTPASGKKFKRCELNLLEKVELLQQHSAGKPERELSKMFGVGRSQVYSTLKRKNEILEAYERLGNTNRKRLHSRAESDEINQLTWHWFKEIAKMKSVQISGPMLQAKAKEFANQLGRDDFKASNGWLDTFRKRHNIKFSTGQGFVYDPPENIPLGSIYPLELMDDSANEKAKPKKRKKDKVCKRKDLTIEEKVQLIFQSEGKSQRQLATMFGVGKSQVHSILRRKDEIVDTFSRTGKGGMKRLNHRAENDDVNRLTWQWFQEAHSRGEGQLTGVLVQAKAREIAKQLGRDDFKASNGWLDSFRRRNNIVTNDHKNLVICDEKDILSWREKLPEYTREYEAKDVFSVSETVLFFTSMPEQVVDAAQYQIKKRFQSQNVSVVMCCNILGEFETPVVIGKQEKTEADIPSDVPVTWRWSTSTWSTVEFFTEWVVSLDQRMGEQGRKIVLFVDRAPPDATEIILENVQMVCPPTYSIRLQPLCHGVVDAFKRNYQKRMLSALLTQMASVNEGISKVLSYVSVLDACLWLSQAVKDIDAGVVTRAFFDCGFDVGFCPDIPSTEDGEVYDNLIKKAIESFARKPLSYYIGGSNEDGFGIVPHVQDASDQSSHYGNSDAPFQNEDASQSTGSTSQVNRTEESSDNESDASEVEEESDGNENELTDPSVSFSLEVISPLARSLYASSRRAKRGETYPLSSSESPGDSQHDQYSKSVASNIKSEEGSEDATRPDRPILRSRGDALKAAESLMQYCIHNNLNHVIGNVKAILKEL